MVQGPGWPRAGAETPRGRALCAYAILFDEPLVVPDTLRDLRFAENPLVTGASIVTRDGLRLGTVCVASPRPRAGVPPRDDLARLTDLAAIAMDQLEMRVRTRALAEERAALMREADCPA